MTPPSSKPWIRSGLGHLVFWGHGCVRCVSHCLCSQPGATIALRHVRAGLRAKARSLRGPRGTRPASWHDARPFRLTESVGHGLYPSDRNRLRHSSGGLAQHSWSVTIIGNPNTPTFAARLRAGREMAMAPRDQTLSSRTFYGIPRGMVPSVN